MHCMLKKTSLKYNLLSYLMHIIVDLNYLFVLYESSRLSRKRNEEQSVYL